jgi:hypothetical protein
MIEYCPVDPLALHPSTHELIQRDYLWLKLDYPNCTPIQQICNSIMHFAPDLPAAIASIQQATQRLLVDIAAYPDEAEKLARALPYLADFCELVQETSAKLHNGESAQRAAIEALNRLHTESERREEARRQQWLAEVAAGDAYFGGPGAYQLARDAHYAALDAKEYAASGERLRAFRDEYHRGEQPQREAEPVQASLWQEATR